MRYAIFSFIIILILFTSCEKIIEIPDIESENTTELALTEEISVDDNFYDAEIVSENTTELTLTEEISVVDDSFYDEEIESYGIRVRKGKFISKGGLVDIDIEYPHIDRDDSNLELRDIINKQLYDVVIMEEMRNWSDITIYSEIRYELTLLNENFLCIHYSGILYGGIAIHSNIKTGIILNLNTGERVSMLDFFTDEQITNIIINKLNSGEYSIANELYELYGDREFYKDVFEEYFKEEFIERFSIENYLYNYYICDDNIVLLTEFRRDCMYLEFEIENAPWK